MQYHTGEVIMNTYIVLAKFTDKALSTIQEHAERVKRFKEIAQGEGAKVVGFYMLMGKYDIATVIEAPTPEVMAKLALIVGRRGNVTTMTLPAFTENEQFDMIAKLK
jgi:uncharacterized protein with GYD domain